jgi:hypothetical protein
MMLEILRVPDGRNLPPMLKLLAEVTNLPVDTRAIDNGADADRSGIAGSPTLLIDPAAIRDRFTFTRWSAERSSKLSIWCPVARRDRPLERRSSFARRGPLGGCSRSLAWATLPPELKDLVRPALAKAPGSRPSRVAPGFRSAAPLNGFAPSSEELDLGLGLGQVRRVGVCLCGLLLSPEALEHGAA